MPPAATPAVPTPAAPAPAETCANCGHGFGAERTPFCPACGQESRLRAPTLGEFAQQFGGAYFATEGALWRTLKLLLLKPGELTRQYLAGRRRHFVLPLRLYLSVSVVVLLVLRLATQADTGPLRAQVEAPVERPQEVQINLPIGRAGLKNGVFFCQGLPGWLCQRVQRRIDVEPAAMVQEVGQIGERLVANLGAGMFVLLPAFALWLKGAYLNRRLRYTEHLVFALHVHTFWFAMLGITLAGLPWLTPAAALAVPVYTLLAMRRVYGGRWGPLLLRSALVSVLYGIALTLTLAVLALWVFLT